MAILGMSCKAYRASAAVASTVAATVAAMTWTEATNLKDVSINTESAAADTTTRANSGWRTYLCGLKDATIEFEMVWETTDTHFTAIQTAFLAGTTVPMAFMDGAIATAGKQGFVANFTVENFSRNEPLEEAVTVSVTLRPTSYPQWFTAP